MGVCRSRMGWGVNPGGPLAVPGLPALRAHPDGEERSVCTVRTPQALTQICLELRVRPGALTTTVPQLRAHGSPACPLAQGFPQTLVPSRLGPRGPRRVGLPPNAATPLRSSLPAALRAPLDPVSSLQGPQLGTTSPGPLSPLGGRRTEALWAQLVAFITLGVWALGKEACAHHQPPGLDILLGG